MMLLKNDLMAATVTGAIVYLKPGVAAGVARKLESHFVRSEHSQPFAVAATLGVDPVSLPKGRYFPNLGVLTGVVDRGAVEALRADKAVRKVAGAPTLRLIRPVRVAAASLSAKRTWGIRALSVPSLWAEGLDGSGVSVAHLDTGADGKHPALTNAITSFAEFDFLGAQRQGLVPAYDSDEQGHGTHTAATIAGRPVKGQHVGVAPGAQLCSAMVIEGGNVLDRVLGGMDWAIESGARVLNMSLGFPGYWDEFLDLTRILRARGILPVFAIGNEGPATSRSPGNYAEALSVGAMDAQREVATFSSSDHFSRPQEVDVPDLVAPGVNVVSARPGGGYQSMDGSSMATPHVAGLAALLWQAKPTATVTEVEAAILGSGQSLAQQPAARQGRGAPDAKQALKLLGI